MIKNLSIHQQQSGAGNPALVFLHYWGGSHRTWDRVVEDLNSTWQYVSYDSRGWRLSDKTAISFALADLAEEALGMVKALGLHDFVLVGHSLGGKVAQLAASTCPVGLRALILFAPATPTSTHFPEEALQQQLHAYDNASTVHQTTHFLSVRSLCEDVLTQIVDDSLSATEPAKLV